MDPEPASTPGNITPTEPIVPASAPASLAPAPVIAYQSNPLALIKPSIAAFGRSFVNVLLVLLMMIGLFLIPILAFALLSFLHLTNAPVNVVIFLVGAVMVIYLPMLLLWMVTKAVLSAARGQKVTFRSTLPLRWNDPLKLLWTEVVTGTLIILGYLLLIVPGIFATAFWSFAPFVTVDTGEWGWAALKKSRDIMRGRTWDVLGAICLSSAFAVVSLIPIIGPLANLVFTALILPLVFIRYISLIELKKQPGWESARTSPWNYAILIVGLVVGGTANYFGIQQLLKGNQPVEINSQSY